jgi:alkylhydroperoxidase family enzyme
MVTWQSLSKQDEQLSWREIAPQGDRQRLALIWIWQLVLLPV